MGDDPKEIGDYIIATLVQRTEQNLWESDVDSIPNEWNTLFNPRKDESWEAGDSGWFRIYKIVPHRKEIWLTANSFGFSPISELCTKPVSESTPMCRMRVPLPGPVLGRGRRLYDGGVHYGPFSEPQTLGPAHQESAPTA